MCKGYALFGLPGRLAVLLAVVAVGLPTAASCGDILGDHFGLSVALKGGRVIVGSVLDNDLTKAGAAYVFNPITGASVHYLTAPDGFEGQWFGQSVAVENAHAVVGAFRDNHAGEDSGAAYVFDMATGAASHKLTATDATVGDHFGMSVSTDGTVVVVGASDAAGAVADTGAAYVFDASTGAELRKLTASDGGGSDCFGTSVAVSGDLAVVGAYRHRGDGSLRGAAYVFDVTTGQQLYKLTPSDGAGADDNFGMSVAIDGDLAIVGAPRKDVGPTGAAYVYDLTTGDELFKLPDPAAEWGADFGHAVAIDGQAAIVGAFGADNGGVAYVFDATTGDLLTPLEPDEILDEAQQFGEAVAIDGNTALIGAPYAFLGSVGDDPIVEGPGAAYLFDLTAPVQTHKLTGPGVVWSGPPDLDLDGDVDIDDLEICIATIGQPPGFTAPDFDADGDHDADDCTHMIEVYMPYDANGDGEPDGYGTFQGDFNFDGAVDLADLTTLRTNAGLSGMGYVDGDANYDTTVDLADLVALRTNAGNSVTAPEPLSIVLLAAGAALALRRKPRDVRAG